MVYLRSHSHRQPQAGRLRRCAALLARSLPVLLAGCMFGPNYKRPSMYVPDMYKEIHAGDVTWVPAQHSNALPREAWWSIFHDPTLSDLEARVKIGNQNLKAYEAAYREALAQVDETHADLLPTLSVASRERRYHFNGRYGIESQTKTRPSASGFATWKIDAWGQIRRQLESDRAAARATEDQLAWLTLDAQVQLATDYIALRYNDSLTTLLGNTLAAYRRSLAITEQQHLLGAAAETDVVTARTQMQNAEAKLIDVGIARAKYEHAIALLTGVPPSALSIPMGTLPTDVPTVPLVLPSQLLERRPDVAEAEQKVVQENALIGSAIAAYFPEVNLGGVFGYSGPDTLFKASNELWSVAVGGTEVLFDGGARSAKVRAARDSYAQSVANYRQQVLIAFQSVEDELSSLRVLSQEAEVQTATIASARHAVDLALGQYQLGATSYTTVASAQIAALTNIEDGLGIQQRRLAESVALIEALGGGWGETSPARHE